MDVPSALSVAGVDNRLLRRSEVERITGLKRSQLYNLIKQGQFPRQVRLGVRMGGGKRYPCKRRPVLHSGVLYSVQTVKSGNPEIHSPKHHQLRGLALAAFAPQHPPVSGLIVRLPLPH